jgi:stress response protein SCP2/5-methylcytosine-specific restriction endonuclease McrA
VTNGAKLVRGGNTVVPTAEIRVEVSWHRGTGVDACALLLTENDKVRDDNDFVFYNQPEHATGSVRLAEENTTSASVTVDLRRVPPEIHRVVIAGSLEQGTFESVPDLRVSVLDHSDQVANYDIADIEPVTAMVFGELYRREDAWKFRAVGQGWANGLGGLATDFGISVEDESSVISQAESMRHLQQMVTFAFADDLIEQHEVDEFDEAVTQLGVSGPAVDAMRERLRRGLLLAQISEGRLPEITDSALFLDAGEKLHLDTPAVHIRNLENGDLRRSAGRVIATSRKLMFLSQSSRGHDLTWAKVVELRPEYSTVVVLGTAGRGGGAYEVEDPEHVAAVLAGVLKVSRRTATVQIPAQRDSRAVPHAVKVEVWRRDGGACVDCSATEYLEFDHVIPWSMGGATSIDNLQLLCRKCNLAKGARI